MAIKNVGLQPKCTAKRSHVGSGGRVAQFIAAIAHQKCVVLCKQYERKINGDMSHQDTFSNSKDKMFLCDGYPVQNS